MFFTLESPSAADHLGYEDPLQVQLRRPVGPVFTDGLSVIVDDTVADDLRTACPKGLKLGLVLVWAAQPRMNKRLADRNVVSSKYALRLHPSLVVRREDGTVRELKMPWVLDKQPVAKGVEVFVLAEHPTIPLFSTRARDILQRHAPRLRWAEIPTWSGGLAK